MTTELPDGKDAKIHRLLFWAGVPLTVTGVMVLLWVSEPVAVPVLFAILVAQLLSPLVSRLERWLPSAAASAVAMVLMIAVIGAVIGLLVNQAATLDSSLPEIQQRLGDALTSALAYLHSTLGFTFDSKAKLIQSAAESSATSGGLAAFSAFSFTIAKVIETLLIAVMAFLMLIYRQHFRRHLKRLGDKTSVASVARAIDQMVELGQSYILGVGAVVMLVGAADSIGLALLGVPLALLFGVLGGLAVLLPYIGVAIAAPFCAILAGLITGTTSAPLAVLGVFGVVHLLEGQVLSPMIVGSKVNLNPLATILCVLIGGELWGPAGMLLFIPMGGLLRLALEALPETEPLAKLLGPITPKVSRVLATRRKVTV